MYILVPGKESFEKYSGNGSFSGSDHKRNLGVAGEMESLFTVLRERDAQKRGQGEGTREESSKGTGARDGQVSKIPFFG